MSKLAAPDSFLSLLDLASTVNYRVKTGSQLRVVDGW